MKEEERQAAATWDAMTFVTYQVNAIGLSGFKSTEVLLDNQANVIIVRPELLSAFEKADAEVRINGEEAFLSHDCGETVILITTGKTRYYYHNRFLMYKGTSASGGGYG
jgi:hypothetical protein